MKPIEDLIRQSPDPPQRMAGRDPLLHRHKGKQGAAAFRAISPLSWAVAPIVQRRLVCPVNSYTSPDTLTVACVTR